MSISLEGYDTFVPLCDAGWGVDPNTGQVKFYQRGSLKCCCANLSVHFSTRNNMLSSCDSMVVPMMFVTEEMGSALVAREAMYQYFYNLVDSNLRAFDADITSISIHFGRYVPNRLSIKQVSHFNYALFTYTGKIIRTVDNVRITINRPYTARRAHFRFPWVEDDITKFAFMGEWGAENSCEIENGYASGRFTLGYIKENPIGEIVGVECNECSYKRIVNIDGLGSY